jgi:hypothetical protein
MFGRMMVTPIAQVGTDADLQTAISSLLRSAEQADIVRWIEFPNSVLLFLLVPEIPNQALLASSTRCRRDRVHCRSNVPSLEQGLHIRPRQCDVCSPLGQT